MSAIQFRSGARRLTWLAALVLSACGGGNTDLTPSTNASTANAGESRARALAVSAAASAALMPDVPFVLRNVGDPTALVAGPTPMQYGVPKAATVLHAATSSAVPPDATLRYVANSSTPGCGFVDLASNASNGSIVRGASLLPDLASGKLVWNSFLILSPDAAASLVFCPETAPGGRGIYLRRRAEPTKVLSIVNGQLVLSVEASTPAFIASASFDALPIPAFVNNQLPTVSFLSSDEDPTAPTQAGQTRIIEVTAADPEGQLDRVELLDGTTVVATATAPPYALPWKLQRIGGHVLTARAWDKQGAWTDSDGRMQLGVVEPSGPKVLSAAITSPVAGSTLEAGYYDILTIAVDKRGPNLQRVEIYDGVQLVSGSKVWLDPGVHTLTVFAVDYSGYRVMGTPVTVNVVPPAAGTPKVTLLSPTSGQAFKAGQVIHLTAKAEGLQGTDYVLYKAFPAQPDPNKLVENALVDPANSTGAPQPLNGRDQLLPTGRWLVYAEVYYGLDNANKKVVRSAPVTIDVASAAVPKPVLNVGSVVAPNTAATLTVKVDGFYAANGVRPLAVLLFDGTELLTSQDLGPKDTVYTGTWTPTRLGSHALFVKVQYGVPGIFPRDTVSSSPVIVQVRGTGNAPPTVSLVQPSPGSALLGAPITLRATPGDVDGYIRRVEFFDGTQLIGSATASPWSMSWTGAAGVHTLTAKAYDNSGNSTTSPPISLTLKASNLAPTVSVILPAAGSTVQAGTAVTILTNPGDKDGYVRRVEFYDGSTLIGSASGRPWAVSWTPTAGSHTLTAKAVDNSDVSTTSAAVVVTAAP